MKADRSLPDRYGTEGHNKRPIYPDDIQTRHHHAGKGCLPGFILLLALIVMAGAFASAHFFIPWWVESQAGQYTPFNTQTSAGIISNAKTGESNVSQLTLAIPIDGSMISTASPYLLRCKEWRLHADILTTPSWINTQGHSWYQLTYIEGNQCRDQHGKVQQSMTIKITGSDDSFGESVLQGRIWGFIIGAKEITSNFMPVANKTYKVTITPTALSLVASH